MFDEIRLGDVRVVVGDDFVASVTIDRPPENYFDVTLIGSLADAYEMLDDDPRCRVIVLRSNGKHFCAGAHFGGTRPTPADGGQTGPHLYDEAIRMFAAATPVVAAIQGGAIGGGLGVALSADFRVGVPEARMSANFARLGFHQGFGLTVTLPALVGQQQALEMLLIGNRIDGTRCFEIGLLDRLVSLDDLDAAARSFAVDIATSAPIAVRSIRQTMRDGLVERLRAATDREKSEQEKHWATHDFTEGTASTRERRPPRFTGT